MGLVAVGFTRLERGHPAPAVPSVACLRTGTGREPLGQLFAAADG